MKRRNFLIEIASFLWTRKAYWIVPVTLFILVMIFIIITGSSPVTGFVYSLF